MIKASIFELLTTKILKRPKNIWKNKNKKKNDIRMVSKRVIDPLWDRQPKLTKNKEMGIMYIKKVKMIIDI